MKSNYDDPKVSDEDTRATYAETKAVHDSTPKPTELEEARSEFGRLGIRFDGIGQKADLAALERFIRAVVADERATKLNVVR